MVDLVDGDDVGIVVRQPLLFVLSAHSFGVLN